MTVRDVLAVALSACGVLSALFVFGATRRGAMALAVALELWTAAGLLRLTEGASWRAVAGAAAIIATRKVVARVFLLYS